MNYLLLSSMFLLGVLFGAIVYIVVDTVLDCNIPDQEPKESNIIPSIKMKNIKDEGRI